MNVVVRLKGAAGPAIANAFEDISVRTETVLVGELPDEAALYGLLARVRDLGLHVVDVQVSTDGT